jgi:hypothetical protein
LYRAEHLSPTLPLRSIVYWRGRSPWAAAFRSVFPIFLRGGCHSGGAVLGLVEDTESPRTDHLRDLHWRWSRRVSVLAHAGGVACYRGRLAVAIVDAQSLSQPKARVRGR